MRDRVRFLRQDGFSRTAKQQREPLTIKTAAQGADLFQLQLEGIMAVLQPKP